MYDYGQHVGDALAAFQSAADASPVVLSDVALLQRDYMAQGHCEVSLVIVGTDPDSLASRTVDALTGRRGFSHVYLDLCLEVDGRHRVVDYSIENGVHFAMPDAYAARRRVWITLPPQRGADLWSCVKGRMARPLRVMPLALGNVEDTCIGLVVACMPADFRTELEALREGPCVSPNTLARWAGVT